MADFLVHEAIVAEMWLIHTGKWPIPPVMWLIKHMIRSIPLHPGQRKLSISPFNVKRPHTCKNSLCEVYYLSFEFTVSIAESHGPLPLSPDRCSRAIRRLRKRHQQARHSEMTGATGVLHPR